MGAENRVKEEEMSSSYQVQHAAYNNPFHGFPSYPFGGVPSIQYGPRHHDSTSPSPLINFNSATSSPPNAMGHGHSPAMMGISHVPTPPTPNTSPSTPNPQDGVAHQSTSLYAYPSTSPYRIPVTNYRTTFMNPHHQLPLYQHLHNVTYPGYGRNLQHQAAYFNNQTGIGTPATAPGIYPLHQRESVYAVSDLPTSVVEHHQILHHPQEDEDVEIHMGARPLPSYPWWMKRAPQSSTATAAGKPRKEGRTRTPNKYRVVYTEHQRTELEKEFLMVRYVTIKPKSQMADQLHLSERQIKIWFQNRRAKAKKSLDKNKRKSQRSTPSPTAKRSTTPPANPNVQQHVQAIQHQQVLQQHQHHHQAHMMQMQAHHHQHQNPPNLAHHHYGDVATENQMASLPSVEAFQHPKISIAPVVPSCNPVLRREHSGSPAASSRASTLGHPSGEQLSNSVSPVGQMASSSMQHQLHQQQMILQQQVAPDLQGHPNMYGMNPYDKYRLQHQHHLHQQSQQVHPNSLQHNPINSGLQNNIHHQHQAGPQTNNVSMISAPGSSEALLMHTDPSAISQNASHYLQIRGGSMSTAAVSPNSSQTSDSNSAGQAQQVRPNSKVKAEILE